MNWKQVHDLAKERGRVSCYTFDEYYKEISLRRKYERILIEDRLPSSLLGIVFETDVCPHFSNQRQGETGSCMKYGSYGHIELRLPWGLPQCSLQVADRCPIYNHGMPITCCINDDPEHPYGSMWWDKRGGRAERVTFEQVYEIVSSFIKSLWLR